MDDSACARIRRLYFVDRVSVCDIAETLRLAAAAVRGALVLPGGQTPWRAPAPLATALAASAPLPRARMLPNPIPVARAALARRWAAQRHR